MPIWYLMAFFHVANDPPIGISARTLSSTSIEVTWSPATTVDVNLITGYNVVYDSNVKFVNEDSVTTTATNFLLTSLEEYVTYNIRVQAVYNDVPGLFSNPVRETTRAAG